MPRLTSLNGPVAPSKIKLFVTDVDGTLTDGGMYYTDQGEYMKLFNTRDGKGLNMLQEAGVQVAVMTSEHSNIVLRRAEKLNVRHVFIGVKDKLAQLTELCTELQLPLASVAYVGDDINDLEVMRTVGLAFAVADADRRVLEAAHIRLLRPGGAGAVREAAECILSGIVPSQDKTMNDARSSPD